MPLRQQGRAPGPRLSLALTVRHPQARLRYRWRCPQEWRWKTAAEWRIPKYFGTGDNERCAGKQIGSAKSIVTAAVTAATEYPAVRDSWPRSFGAELQLATIELPEIHRADEPESSGFSRCFHAAARSRMFGLEICDAVDRPPALHRASRRRQDSPPSARRRYTTARIHRANSGMRCGAAVGKRRGARGGRAAVG